MWEKLKELFQGPKGTPVIIKPLAFEDGLLSFTAEKPLKLKKARVAGPTKRGYMEIEIDILSYDESRELYRGKVSDERFALDAMQVNRRKEVRLDIRIPVTSPDFPGKTLRAEDISLNGARIVTPEPIKQGEIIGLKFHFKDANLPELALRCEVKWCAQARKGVYQCGVRFFNMDQLQRKKVSRFMKNRMALG